MLIVVSVDLNFIIKTVGPPFLGEKRDRNGFAEAVDLQPRAANGVHNGGIVDNFHLDFSLDSPKEEIGVGCSTERVSYHQEREILLLL